MKDAATKRHPFVLFWGRYQNTQNRPLCFPWNSSKYFYTTNLQGDVVAIVSMNGNPVVKYTYDAWGNVLSVTGSRADNLGRLNPLRYRGYVYDVETGLYYLQSRYYNPEWGRFINADALVSTGQGILGNNMYAYCRNNPATRKDASGTDDVSVEDFNQDDNPLNDLGSPSGSGGGGVGTPRVSTTNPSSSGRPAYQAPTASVTNTGSAGTPAYEAPTSSVVDFNSGICYDSYSAFKSAQGSAGEGKSWHHIVEQCQQQKSGFSPQQINNTNNIIPIDNSAHREISALYSSKTDYSQGMTVRNWLAGQTFEYQYAFGLAVVYTYCMR